MLKSLKSLGLIVVYLLSTTLLKSQTFPAGFSQVKVGTVYYPTSMAKLPDGRIFVTEKAGHVRVVKNGVVLQTPFLNVNVEQTDERGLSSISIDPNFASNGYVYVYYVTASSPIHNRLSRFTANGDVAVPGSEVTLIDFEPVTNTMHNGGGMVWGPDGKLYIGIGDDHTSTNAQNLNNHQGKVLRLNPDGSGAAGNPFSGSVPASRIWCYGLRNPWSLAIQAGTGRIFVNDVGEGAWEEINNATSAGKNFGWPGSEGPTSNPAYTPPVYTYHHGDGTTQGCAITGGAFIGAPSNYPAQFQGKYFFTDYCNQWINYIDPSGGPMYNFASNLPASALNSMIMGNDGNLYYFSIAQNSLYKVVYSGGTYPVITQQPVSQSVSQGQSVTFNVAASGAGPLSYQWKKNNVNINGANGSSYTIPNPQAADQGQYMVTVSNSYGSVNSSVVNLTVTPFNAPPSAIINSPANGMLYRCGDIISVSGSATDPEDGPLPASTFTWDVHFQHDQHFHPGPVIPAGSATGTFVIPNTGEVSPNVWYRISLIVKDSKGRVDTSYVEIFPRKSTVNFISTPNGLQLTYDGQPFTTPFSKTAVEGMHIAIGAPSPQTMGGANYNYSGWVPVGAQNQTLTIPIDDAQYQANYTSSGSGGGSCGATGNILREYWLNYRGTTLATTVFRTAPTGTNQLTQFEGPSNFGDNYLSRIRGYVCPPLTGNYIFWIASDNQSELWVSSDANPANKIKRAYVTDYTNYRQWTKYPSQKSASIYLVAGQQYYVEAIHREGSQGDHLSVGWSLPNGAQEMPIPGNRLSSASGGGGGGTNQPPTVSISSPVNSQKFSTPVNITIVANAFDPDGSITKVEFYSGSTKIGETSVAPYQIGFFNLTTGFYTLTAKAYDNLGAVATSAPIQIEVTTCVTPIVTALGPTTFCNGGNVTLSTSAGPDQFQWKRNGTDIVGAMSQNYVATLAGDYQVKTIKGTCVAWSAPIHVTVNACKPGDDVALESGKLSNTSNTPVSEPLEMKVFPNPNSGMFNLEMSMVEVSEGKITVEVVNPLGQIVFSNEYMVEEHYFMKQIELDKDLPAGVYTLRVGIGKNSETTRVVLTK